MGEGISPRMRQLYKRGYRCFINAVEKLLPQPNTWEDRILYFVGAMAEEGKSSCTISSYLSGVRFWLRMQKIRLDEDHYILCLLLRGAKKRDVRRIRLPITYKMLGQICKILPVIAHDRFEERLFRANLQPLFLVCFVWGSWSSHCTPFELGTCVKVCQVVMFR